MGKTSRVFCIKNKVNNADLTHVTSVTEKGHDIALTMYETLSPLVIEHTHTYVSLSSIPWISS